MDPQDRRLISPPGHDSHGVHHCSKCGWPFPNPHPSAKHRRAHKRICGTIEGYKMIHSDNYTHLNVSVDEHLSDEDSKTLSPKVVEKSSSGNESIGIGKNRSEEEAYSNAVTEFSDAGFGSRTEMPLENVAISSDNVEKVAEDDSRTADLEVIERPKDPTDINQMQNQALENGLSTIAPQDGVSSLKLDLAGSSNFDIRPEDSVVEFSNDEKGPECGPINPEEPNTSSKDGDHGVPCSATHIGIETDAKGNKESDRTLLGMALPQDHVPSTNISLIGSSDSSIRVEDSAVEGTLSDTAVSPSKAANESSLLDHNLQEMDRKMSDPVERTTEIKEEQSNDLDRKLSSSDEFFEAESFKPKDEFILNIASTEVTPTEEIDVKSNDGLVEGSITKKAGSEDVHVPSVPGDIPSKDDPGIMFPDFEGHMLIELDRNLDSGEAVKVEDDVQAPVSKVSPLSVQSNDFGASMDSSNLGASVTECTQYMEDEESKHTVEDASVKREPDISELNMVCGEKDDAEASIVAMRSEIESEESHNVCSHEEEWSPVNPLVSPISAEVSELTKSIASEDASNPIKDQIRMFSTVGNDGMEVATCENFTVNAKETSKFASNSLETQLLRDDDAADQTIRTEKFSGDESSESATDGISKMHSTIVPKSSSCSSKFFPVNDGSTEETESPYVDRVLDSTNVGNNMTNMGYPAETHCNLQNSNDKGIQEVRKDVGIGSNNEMPVEGVGAVSIIAKSNQSVKGDFCQKSPESGMRDDPMLSPVAAESALQSLPAIEDNQGKEFDVSAVGISSGSLEELGDTALAKQQPGVSAVEILEESSSHSGSVEGNWGSVSVVSTQSDALAVDAEALPPSNDFKKSLDEENINTKKPTVSKERHHFSSDTFEPPSFMTLVEPKIVSDQNADSPEIPTLQNPQQPDTGLQAAWFPSLMHAVNGSSGRKKNEEIIAKVTRWSSGKHHAPLKSLLVEANLETKAKLPNPTENPIPTRKDETSAKDSGLVVGTTAKPDPGRETPASQPAKVEMAKEWNSPARYPAAIKREKRKLKGKPYWAQFVCCSSVNWDL